MRGEMPGRLRWRPDRIVRWIVGGACLTGLTSCAQPQSRPVLLAPASRPVLHAVYAEELRSAMRELNSEARQQTWMQLYTGGPVVNTAELADTAGKMAQVAATRLPQTIAHVPMSPNDRQLFLSLAGRLHDEAVILKQQAQRNELTAAQATMNRLINTCNTCHTMFRGVAGPME